MVVVVVKTIEVQVRIFSIIVMCVSVQQAKSSALTSSSSRRTAVSKRPPRPAVVNAVGQPCRVRYAVLTDRLAAKQNIEVCGGANGSRERHVYVSTGNVVEISIDVRRDNPDYFVLLYEGQTFIIIIIIIKQIECKLTPATRSPSTEQYVLYFVTL